MLTELLRVVGFITLALLGLMALALTVSYYLVKGTPTPEGMKK